MNEKKCINKIIVKEDTKLTKKGSKETKKAIK